MTIEGLDWAAIVPGVRLRIGEVLAEVTDHAIPCTKNSQWFESGNHNRMHLAGHPGSVSARVVAGGILTAGDPVAVLDS